MAMPKQQPAVQQFVLLPTRGLQARQPHSSPAVRSALLFLYDHLQDPKVQPPAGVRLPLADMRVLDSIHADGAKLIEMRPEAASVLRASYPGLRIVPVVYFYPAVAPRQGIAAVRAKTTKRVAGKLTVQVLSGSGDGPVTGATVVAFTDFASRAGAAGTTDANGRVSLALGASSKKIDRLYIYAQRGFWGLLKRSFTLTNGMTFTLRAIDLSYVDELRYIYPNIPATAGGGVSVGVIDTGIADHPDLTIAGGQNTVVGEAPSDYGDNGEGHGTHVAGIIAAHGTPPKGVRGVAPVSFPASDPLSIAVSALGRKGTYPADAVEGGDVMAPFATSDPDYYITSFSNVGPEIALTGPGDGIISTFPGGYAVLDGTSMATPAATGAAARLLGMRNEVMQMPRDAARSDAIAQLLLQSAKPLGLGITFEGRGLLS